MEEMFTTQDKATDEQIRIITTLYLMISVWNDYLADKVGKMITNLTDDEHYYTDVQTAEMMTLITMGEVFARKFDPTFIHFSRVILPTLQETGEMKKDDLYTLAFAVADVKTYMVEMDRSSHVIGIYPPLPSGKSFTQILEQALTDL